MKKMSVMLLAVVVCLTLIGPAAASGPTGYAGIYSVAPCKDTTTVAVSGSSTYATNRLEVRLFTPNSNGEYELLRETTTGNFGSGTFLMPITLKYVQEAQDEGTILYVEVQLQASSGNGFVDVGAMATTKVAVEDRYCQGKCSVLLNSTDAAPANGVVTLRSHYGSWFRPEGRLYSAIPVRAGQKLFYSVVGVSCDWSVRAWYYPAAGKDRTPKMLPAQYWPHEFAATTEDGAIPYTTRFAKGLAATAPLEPDDPYAPK